MIKKAVGIAIVVATLYNFYKRLSKTMIKDREFLKSFIAKKETPEDRESIIMHTLAEAKKLENTSDFESAATYYSYAIQELKCEVNYVLACISTTATKNVVINNLQHVS